MISSAGEGRVSLVRVTAVTSLLLMASSLMGCPREGQTPARADGLSCETVADCNRGVSCGPVALRACVDSRCEGEPSLILSCPIVDGG